VDAQAVQEDGDPLRVQGAGGHDDDQAAGHEHFHGSSFQWVYFGSVDTAAAYAALYTLAPFLPGDGTIYLVRPVGPVERDWAHTGDRAHPEIPGILRAQHARVAGPLVLAPRYEQHAALLATPYGVQVLRSSAATAAPWVGSRLRP